MSELVYTAQFVRVGAGSFGPKPKDATVFAQLLVGGSGLWTVAKTTPPFGPSVTVAKPFRLFAGGSSDFDVLRAAFALAEPEVPLGDSQSLAENLRGALAGSDDFKLSDPDIRQLAAAVADLNVHLHLTHFSPGFEVRASDGNWTVANATAELS